MSDFTLKVPVPASTMSTMSVPSTAPAKLNTLPKTGSGSATGNPRNKCALKPGYSLMHWVRLCNSGEDLAGTAGRTVPVSMEELARHNKPDDAWMAIRGRVFNVTRYMDFHPGGVDELMRGVGRDATKLFDEVHAWVNYPQLLGKCYIGPLKQTVKVDNDLRRTILQPTSTSTPPPPLELVPRFDWIQQRSELTLFLYTRQLANPGLMLKQQSPQRLQIRVQLGHVWHVFDVELLNEVEWPPKEVRIGAESGKIEVILTKAEATPWTSYGEHKVSQLDPTQTHEDRFAFDVVHCQSFNHDSFEICLQGAQERTLLLPPIGYHVAIEAVVKGEVIRRNYTPIPSQFLCNSSDAQVKAMGFLVKSYDTGGLSSHMKTLRVGVSLLLGLPRGSFQLQKLASHRNILLLAAGSGITPMLGLVEPLLKRSTNRIERLHLIYFNKTSSDIWAQDALQDIQSRDERFSIDHMLATRMSSDILNKFFPTQKTERFTFFAICGPSGFNTSTNDLLKQLNVQSDQMHIFQG